MMRGLRCDSQGRRIRLRRERVAVAVGVVALAAVLAAPAAARAAEGWSAAASMSTARMAHTATLLNDGTVLVTGGVTGCICARSAGIPNSYLASAERYDPATDTWSAASSLGTPRLGHRATLLKDGRVLVTGGNTWENDTLADAQLYDPVSNAWSPAPSMNTPRNSHTATLLDDGRVLVTGGETWPSDIHEIHADAELYDPVSNTWSPAASMSTVRSSHRATLLDDGKVLVSGGTSRYWTRTGPEHAASAELYDPVSDAWSAASSMSTARVGHTATLLDDGKVLVSGGERPRELGSLELYDPVTDTWSPASSMIPVRVSYAATLLDDGKVLVTGGCCDPASGDSSASVERYDPVSDAWSPASSMITARSDHSATLLHNGKVLVTGGSTGLFTTATAELYTSGPPAAGGSEDRARRAGGRAALAR